ncbi:MAG: 4Fe-4S binding protein [Bdellovibrionales bacterium]|nr:4Fe-4S binding protein [Bdellovibrionales bacterium]
MASQITAKCTNCKACAAVCPTGSIFAGAGVYVIDSDTCDDSHLCVQVCPVEGAIRVAPRPTKSDQKPAPDQRK